MAIRQTIKRVLGKAKELGKKIFTYGLPSTKGLQEAVGEMKELQKKNLPTPIYRDLIKKIIQRMK